MADWNSEQYLKFASERTRPAADLARAISLSAPQRIVDLGCGPGNSTEIVAQRWPEARVTGVDDSESMLGAARRAYPRWHWQLADIAQWAAATGAAPEAERPDLVFANAALQWVPRHPALIPTLFRAVHDGGALAFQVPFTEDVSHQRRMRVLAESPQWQARFSFPPKTWHVEPAGFYYDVLAAAARRVDLWITDYAHVLENAHAIVEWYRGTGLRPYLEALRDDASREAFLADYYAAIAPDHPPQADGRVIMYFRRLFVVAYR